MTDAKKTVGMNIAMAALVLAGVCLLIGAAFCFFLGFIEPNGRHGAGGLVSMSLLGLFQAVIGVGLLSPRPLAKLLSSLVLAAAGVWILFHDSFRRENWWIYCLLCVPLALTVWLNRVNGGFAFRRLRNAA